eukprot:6200519-Pleurochrysis_carterae.AAC.1
MVLLIFGCFALQAGRQHAGVQASALANEQRAVAGRGCARRRQARANIRARPHALAGRESRRARARLQARRRALT